MAQCDEPTRTTSSEFFNPQIAPAPQAAAACADAMRASSIATPSALAAKAAKRPRMRGMARWDGLLRQTMRAFSGGVEPMVGIVTRATQP
ncbi:MAG TPA: hypothetical protein VF216_01460 [Mizugakiibacter sp.]